MRRRSLSVGVLSILMVLVLAAMGLVYTLWSETLTISGTVSTGNVDVEFSTPTVRENDHGKEVGTCAAELSQLREPNDKLTITVGNGYPSYECWVTFDVHSAGTIPVLVYQPDITAPTPPGDITVRTENCYLVAGTPVPVPQLHRSERAYCTIYIHVEQAADEGATYSFSGSIEARQFNEPRPTPTPIPPG